MHSGFDPDRIKLIPTSGFHQSPITLEAANTLIGRSSECEVCIEDPSMSRKHLLIAGENGLWVATDLGSKTGTFLNDTRLVPDKADELRHNDTLRLGMTAFRIELSKHFAQSTLATTRKTVPEGSVIESISPTQLKSLAHQRLDLLIQGCAEINQTQSETQLADAVINLCLSGTGFHRAAVLRWNDTPDEVEVLASHSNQQKESIGFEFSRSLLQTASTGSIAKLTSQSNHQYGQSIAGLGISQALCTPLFLDSAVIGAIYLDTREDESLPQPDATSFCHAVSQVASLALSNLNRTEMVIRQKELDADLKIAQEAQAFLLPAPFGTVGKLRYASKTCPGSSVGGDLFDIFQIDDHKTGICFGDITGHGIGAAILMTALLTHLRLMLQSSGDPAIAVSESNTYLAEHSSARMFATLWVGVFNSIDNTLSYVDAGHGHWFICTQDSQPACPQQPEGMIIGIQPELEYTKSTLKLHSNDRLVLYSDGIIEQPNQYGVRFENDRLVKALSGSASIEQDIEFSFSALNKYIENGNFSDDTSMASITLG